MFCVGSVDESSSAWSENSWIPTARLPTWVEYGRRVRCPPRVVLVDVLRAVAFCANVVSSEPRIANGWFFTQTADVDLRSCVHSGAGGATDGATLREPEASLPAKRRGGAVCAEAATAFAVRTVAFFLNNVVRGCALGVCLDGHYLLLLLLPQRGWQDYNYRVQTTTWLYMRCGKAKI